VPSQPAEPTTTVVANTVVFDWDAPLDNGTPITEYKILIRQADLTYVQDTSACNGANALVVQNTECTVLLSKLTAAPFLLLKGYSINIRVIASNAYGDSLTSDSGNGAVIVLVPDAPINLTNDPSITRDSVIGFTWVDGANDGGEQVIDYKITYDQSTGNYVTLAVGVTA
jgi:hypothetical protein